MRSKLSVAGIVLILAVFNILIASKERSLARGQVVYMELRPVDPRSLMQGDYMVLRYALADQIDYEEDGIYSVYLTVGDDKVAVSVSSTPAPGTVAIKARKFNGAVHFGAESFFFQEGQGRLYDKARYGELRVDSSGSSILTGLLDEKRQPIKPQ